MESRRAKSMAMLRADTARKARALFIFAIRPGEPAKRRKTSCKTSDAFRGLPHHPANIVCSGPECYSHRSRSFSVWVAVSRISTFLPGRRRPTKIIFSRFDHGKSVRSAQARVHSIRAELGFFLFRLGLAQHGSNHESCFCRHTRGDGVVRIVYDKPHSE